ncbi:MAG: DUF4147 domain-containing protein [Pseudomonadaceae bacterium]|nr:DUF4147 domain-containing protein [Pseudomonadaceae bacterium]
MDDATSFLHQAFDEAVAAAGLSADASYWPDLPEGSKLLAVGKAAPAMLQAARARYGPLPSLVVTSEFVDCSALAADVEVHRGSHPVPDERSAAAALAVLGFVSAMSARQALLCLISGGGSALLAAPIEGVTLKDKAALAKALLASGASISEINTVRAATSLVKAGGLLRAAAPALVHTLLVSDVPGDDPAMIASGPTLPQQSDPIAATAVLDRYGIAAPSIRLALKAPMEPIGEPTNSGQISVVASPAVSLASVERWAKRRGIGVRILGDAIEGEARDVARADAKLALNLAWGSQRDQLLLAGGETTVTVRGKAGRGGRNSEYALALAIALDAHPRIWALAADTDGIDGSGPHAGAFVRPSTLADAAERGADARAHLDGHNSATFFAHSGDLLDTGATGTNVNDFRAIFIRAARRD